MKNPIKRILIAAGLILLAAVAYIGFHMWRTVAQIPEAYAAWDAATLVIEHLDTHGGEWPRSWEELFAAAKTLPNNDRRLHGTSPDRLAKLVRIDWNADPREMTRASASPGRMPFHVITRADGRDFPTLWTGAEPNTLVWEYLNKKNADARLPTHGAVAAPPPER